MDGTPLVYSIATTASLPVMVGRHTGDVCLSAALDYDTAHVHEFNVTATDQGHLPLIFNVITLAAAIAEGVEHQSGVCPSICLSHFEKRLLGKTALVSVGISARKPSLWPAYIPALMSEDRYNF